MNLFSDQNPRRSLPKIIPGKATKTINLCGSLTSQEADITDRDCLEVSRDVIASLEVGQRLAREFGIPITYNWSTIEHKGRYPDISWRQACAPVKAKKFKGALTLEQMLTFTTVLHGYLSDTRDILIHGSPQVAKTICFTFSFIMIPLVERLLYGRLCVPLISTPNLNNLQLSTKRELETTFALYADATVTSSETGETLPISYIKTDILDRALDTGIGAKDWDTLILKRNRPQIETFMEAAPSPKFQTINPNIKKFIAENNCLTVHFIDECHNGSSKKSVIEDCEKGFISRNPHTNLRRVAISATASEIMGLTSWNVIPTWVPENFRGLTIYNGQRLPTISGNVPPIPEIRSIEDSFPCLVQFIDDSTLLTSEKSYYYKFFKEEMKVDYDNLPPDKIKYIKTHHEKFWTNFGNSIFGIFQSSVTPKFPFFFLRPFSRIIDCDRLYQGLLSKSNSNYKILKYYGNNLDPIFGGGKTEKRTIKEVLIDEYLMKERFCLVIAASGRSRMGDSYPPQCKHFMDFVRESVTWDAIIQATYGRAHGIGKESICYFLQDYCDELTRFIANGCYDEAKPYGPRTNYIDDKDKEYHSKQAISHRVIQFFQNSFME